MNIFLLLLLVGSFFALTVLAVSLAKNCSTKNATIAVRDFLSEILDTLLKKKQKQQFYPTVAGYDGFRILPELVDSEFESVRRNFAVCYCTYCKVSNDENCVVYCFSIQRKPDSPDDGTLSALIQKQAEEVVTHTMRSCDYYLPAEPLTAVELFPAELRVAFARTEDGIKTLDKLKRGIRRRRFDADIRNCITMYENWDDSGES